MKSSYITAILALLFTTALMAKETPQEAMQLLVEGNQRYVKGKGVCPTAHEKKRKDLLKGQSPFAVIVACADSRVAPEIIFDQGKGELFVVRVAGNVIGPYELESINYAAKYLGSSCIVVVGHQNCGAVNAVIQNTTDDIVFISQLIKPSVILAKEQGTRNLLERSIKLNAVTMAEFLADSPMIKKLIKENGYIVKPAYFDMSTGSVQFLNL